MFDKFLNCVFSSSGSAHGVAVSGNYVYLADGSNGLVIVDISSPLSPVFVSELGGDFFGVQ